DRDGSSYAGGAFTSIGGQTRNHIAKLSTSGSGTADATWGPNPNASVGVLALALDGSGNIYVGGSFTSIGGQSRNHIAKLSTSGSGTADANWNPNPSDVVLALALGGSGNVYAGGSFSSVGGQTRAGFAALSVTTAVADP